MCTRLILHGDFSAESDLARQMMDATGISYRFECGADPQEVPTLMTPGGRYRGLDAIRRVLGESKADQQR